MKEWVLLDGIIEIVYSGQWAEKQNKMNKRRNILHCDLNNFFASVECLLNPQLASCPVAVCGNPQERKGIVLAKNEKAKKFGVVTAEPIWRAQKKCPGLVLVTPNHGEYRRYSRSARAIYERYTDQVEAFGIDECYLDVTGSIHLFGDAFAIAQQIKTVVRQETGLTISVGVSFNKIFAKLGSDMQKPDAITCIMPENFREKIWPMPAGNMLGIGRKTAEKLAAYGIMSIGDVANAQRSVLVSLLGKAGDMIWEYANGEDSSPVAAIDEKETPKSIGHGMTTAVDLKTNQEVWELILWLSQDVSRRMREYGLYAHGVSIAVRNNQMENKEFQCQLPKATQSATLIANQARELFENRYNWKNPVRLITITAIHLSNGCEAQQLSLLDDGEKTDKIERIDDAVSQIRNRFGERSVQAAVIVRSKAGKADE